MDEWIGRDRDTLRKILSERGRLKKKLWAEEKDGKRKLESINRELDR